MREIEPPPGLTRRAAFRGGAAQEGQHQRFHELGLTVGAGLSKNPFEVLPCGAVGQAPMLGGGPQGAFAHEGRGQVCFRGR